MQSHRSQSAIPPDYINNKVPCMSPETVSTTPKNRSTSERRSNKRMSGRKSRNISENRKVEHKKNVLSTNVEMATSAIQRFSYRTTSEQAVNMKSPSPAICTSKSFQEHADHGSDSTKKQSSILPNQEAFEATSHNSHPEQSSVEPKSNDLNGVDTQATIEKMQELDSPHRVIKVAPDNVIQASDSGSYREKNIHLHKCNNTSINDSKIDTAGINLSTGKPISINDGPPCDISNFDQPSDIMCPSSHLCTIGHDKEDSFTKSNLKTSKDLFTSMNIHEQKQNFDSAVIQIADTPAEINSVFKSMSTNIQRTNQGHSTNTDKTTTNKSSKISCQAFVHTASHGCVRPARPSSGDTHTPAKTSRMMQIQNDTKTFEAQKTRPKSATNNRFRSNNSPAAEKTNEPRSESNRKVNTEKKREPVSSRSSHSSSGKDQSSTKQCITLKDNKPDELVMTTEKSKTSVDTKLLNGSLARAVGPRHTQTSNRRVFNSLKQNASKRTVEADTLNKDTFKSPAQRSFFSKPILEERKWDQSGSVEHYHSKLRSSLLGSDKYKKGHFVSGKQSKSELAGVGDQCVVSRSVTPGKKPGGQVDYSVKINADSGKLKTSPDVRKGHEKALCESSLLKPCAETYLSGVCDISQLSANIEQQDLVPVVCFYWHKCEETLLKVEPCDKSGSQCRLSLDEGLAVLRQIILETTSKNRLGGSDYILSKCISPETRLPARLKRGGANNQPELVSDVCFKLTPCSSAQRGQLPPSDKENHSSQTRNVKSSINFQQDRNFAESLKFFRELSRSSSIGKTSPHKNTLNLSPQKGLDRLETDITDPDSHDISPSIWHSISRKITSYFLNSRFKDKITNLHAYINMIESNATERDDPISSDENSQDIDDFVAKQERTSNYLLPSNHLRPAIITFLGYLLHGKYDAASRDSASEHQLSQMASTSTANAAPWEGQDHSGNPIFSKTNTDVNENRSKFHEVLNVLLRKNSGERHGVNYEELPNISFDDKEKDHKYKHVSDTAACVSSQELLDDQNIRNAFVCSPRGRNNSPNLAEDFKSGMHTKIVLIDAKEKTESNGAHTGTPHFNNMSAEVFKTHSVADTLSRLDDESIIQDMDDAFNSHSNDIVGVNHYLNNNKSMCSEQQRSPSPDICPDPSPDFTLDNSSSVFAIKLSGLGATNIQQHPHLVWILRSCMLHQKNDCIQPEPEANKLQSDNQVEPEAGDKYIRMNETVKSEVRQKNAPESARCKIGLIKESSSVKKKVAESFRSCLSSYRLCNSILSGSSSRGIMGTGFHMITETPNISGPSMRLNKQLSVTMDSSDASTRTTLIKASGFSTQLITGLKDDRTLYCSTLESPMKTSAANSQLTISKTKSLCTSDKPTMRTCTSQSQIDTRYILTTRIEPQHLEKTPMSKSHAASTPMDQFVDTAYSGDRLTTTDIGNCASKLVAAPEAFFVPLKCKKQFVKKCQGRRRAHSTHLTKERPKIMAPKTIMHY